jgi:ketosteroid isomerase-like protein
MIENRQEVDDGDVPRDSPSNAYWWHRLFATIDAGDAAGFVGFLAADAQFRFGNAPVVKGSDAIGTAVTGFFASIRSSRHQLLESWCAKESAGCEGEVTYTRHDGSIMTFPFANVFQMRGSKIASYRIYIDISTLSSGVTERDDHGEECPGVVSRPNS